MCEQRHPLALFELRAAKRRYMVRVDSIVETEPIPSVYGLRLVAGERELAGVRHAPQHGRLPSAPATDQNARPCCREFWEVRRLGEQVVDLFLEPLRLIAPEQLAELFLEDIGLR